MSTRWEGERAAWILARAGRNQVARRRGEKLLIAARRRDRDTVGAGDSQFTEVTTRPLLYRMVFREDGAANTAGWALSIAICLALLAVIVGPALLISRLAYGLWWLMVPKWGPLLPVPYLGISGVVAVVVFLGVPAMGLEGAEHFLASYLGAQMILGLAWTAWLVRSYGWVAASTKKKRSEAKVAPIDVEIEDDEKYVAAFGQTAPNVIAEVEVGDDSAQEPTEEPASSGDVPPEMEMEPDVIEVEILASPDSQQ